MTVQTLAVKANILGANSRRAEANRELLDRHGVLMLNIMSSSGSGKTSLIMQTIGRLGDQYRISVFTADIASSLDAGEFGRQGVQSVQISAAGGCHLDAPMVGSAMAALDLGRTDLIFIENVGNLVCTADFDLGAHKDVVVLSVPEGDDKPRKYPVLFGEADAVLVSKIDVASHFNFNLDAFPEIIRGLNPSARVFPVSAKTGEGLDRWVSWIDESFCQLKNLKEKK